MLLENVLPEAPLIIGGGYQFQHDSVNFYAPCESRSWLEINSVKFLDWPTKKPDLQPIENVWDILAREIYKNGSQ